MDVTVRPLTTSDARRFSEMALAADWNDSEPLLRDLIQAHQGYVIGAFLTHTGTLISACVGYPVNERIGYIGSFVTDPEYRKKGIGKKVWFKCMEVLGDRNIYITAVENMIPVYSKWGFKTPVSHGCLLVKGVPKLPDNFQPNPTVQVQPISAQNFDDVMAFDRCVSMSDRRDAMSVFFASKVTKITKCAVENGRVVGYIMLREGQKQNEVRTSSFYADTPDIAKALLYAAVEDLGPGVCWDCGFSRANAEQSRAVYGAFGLTDIEEGDRGFCTKQEEELPWEKVFAILEFFSLFY